MNKKLLLLPVLLMSSAISACAIRVEHVTLKDMLNKSVSNYATLYVSRSSKQAYAMVSDNDGSFFKLLKAGFDFSAYQWVILALGTVVSFITALVVVKFFMSYLKKYSLRPFAVYRILLGIAVLIFCH